MIKLVASDLDGTIMDSESNINKNNFEAIKAINSKNIDFVVCTGKTYPIIKGLCSRFNANYGIFGNGNQIINLKTGEEIYKKLLTPEEVNECLDIASKNHLHVHVYADNEVITQELLYLDLRNYMHQQKNPNGSSLEYKVIKDVKKYLNDNKLSVSKLVISSIGSLASIKSEISNKIDVSILEINKKGKYRDITIDKEYEYLDISPKGINKSKALKFLGEHLNVDKSEIMAIGDNVNDLEMVKESGVGVAVANAYDELKAVASYTTQNPVEKGGFAEAVYKFIEF